MTRVNEALVKLLVDRFLAWPLPVSVCADGCATKQQLGRSGTNLLTAEEARQMFQYVLSERGPAAELNERVLLVHAKTRAQATVRVWPQVGDIMVFDCEGGYDGERADARKAFIIGQQYRVGGIEIGRFDHRVMLDGNPRWWNGCMFSLVPPK